MPTPYAALREAVCTTIRLADPDIGNVHNRSRWAKNWTEFLDMFSWEMTDGSGTQIRGWMVSRTAEVPDMASSSFGPSYSYTHSLLIRGIMAFSDEDDSELAMNDYVDLVMQTLDRGGAVLDAAVNVVHGYGPASLRLLEPRQFGSVICHYAEIEFPLHRKGD